MKNNGVPPKPADATWTDDQWAAIAVRGSDLLVAAAAGSGKTAVLVERIIRRITDEREPADVDRLLVATFTKAAAAEMRHRIREALEKELARRPKSDHLRRQLALMGRAQVTTLHSFCLDVVRRYTQLLGLNPGFRIANETEAELLRQDVLESVLEEHYASAEEGGLFWRTVDAFGGERSDAGLHALILKLYDESRSHPWPEHWLRQMADRFGERELYDEGGMASGRTDLPEQWLDEAAAASEAAESGAVSSGGVLAVSAVRPPSLGQWQQSLIGDVRLELQGATALLRQALDSAESPGGPLPYAATLRDDLSVAESLLEACGHGWDALVAAFAAASFGKLKPCKGDDIDKELQEQVKELRGQAKDQVSRVQEELFGRTPEQFALELASLSPIVHTLVDLVIEFGQAYGEAKAMKSLVDFGDLEHCCLRVLTDEASTPENLLPSHAALAYREHFVEVLLDEYQDTNRVQEAIVALISREAPGNRFMVGDVKQSIYRFRLAEPGLFLEKYRSFTLDGQGPGRRIDLARNFRSRREVVDAVNYVFQQVMHGSVGEIDYDERAELVYGAGYALPEECDLSVEAVLIDKGEAPAREPIGGSDDDEAAESGGAAGDETTDEAAELETAQLEARAVAARIRKLMGRDGDRPFLIFDKSTKTFRDATYRDFVILLRATQAWAPVFIEELKLSGIPAYAELSTGYFEATEVEVMLSLLKIIDNPQQDIPLAAVLRSPIVRLSAEELTRLRLADPAGSYYDALRRYAEMEERESEAGLRERLSGFLGNLEEWRLAARQGSLPDLIWRLYRETGYFDFVGGLPGGLQRQANLRALYDRARQYESSSLRGLFRFLRFIERMRDSGGDLGTARALGEQEDVVRIMSIHKSKGLEFPVVFVAGMGKMFNRSDMNEPFMTHKELGFGPRYIDEELRVAYPTLPALAIQRRMKGELLAEEMRVLYVALTRAREKLFLLGTSPSAEKLLRKWSRCAGELSRKLPEHELAKARTYLDWVGPALLRHPAAGPWRERIGWSGTLPSWTAAETSSWTVRLEAAGIYVRIVEEKRIAPDTGLQEAVKRLEPAAIGSAEDNRVGAALGWVYPHEAATKLFSKTTVSEMKRLRDKQSASMEWDEAEGEGLAALAKRLGVGGAGQMLPDRSGEGEGGQPPMGRAGDSKNGTGAPVVQAANRDGSGSSAPLPGMAQHRAALARRPRFLEERGLTAAERGTAFHTVMQHMPLDRMPTEQTVQEVLGRMRELDLLTAAQLEAVEPGPIVRFFSSELGQRLLRARKVRREVPFTYALPAEEAYPGAAGRMPVPESVLIQGVIDCLMEDEHGLVLIDFKTDAIRDTSLDALRERYRVQLELYARAVEHIWRRPVAGKFAVYLEGPLVVEL